MEMRSCSRHLDTFLLRSNENEPEELVMQKAKELGQQLSKVYNCSQVTVKKADIPKYIEGHLTCEFFEVWGEPVEAKTA